MKISIEATTLRLGRRGVELLLHTPSGMVYRYQPPGDPKTLRRWLSQRREIRAWIRNREVGVDPFSGLGSHTLVEFLAFQILGESIQIFEQLLSNCAPNKE
jgi:hypothetical protein